MTIKTLHHLFFGHCVNSLVFVLGLGIYFFFSGAPEKYVGPKQSSSNSHNDLKKRWCAIIFRCLLWYDKTMDRFTSKCRVETYREGITPRWFFANIFIYFFFIIIIFIFHLIMISKSYVFASKDSVDKTLPNNILQTKYSGESILSVAV